MVNQLGKTPPLATNSGWAIETSLDVEWAHAMAPNANILLVEANSASLANLLAAVTTPPRNGKREQFPCNGGFDELGSRRIPRRNLVR